MKKLITCYLLVVFLNWNICAARSATLSYSYTQATTPQTVNQNELALEQFFSFALFGTLVAYSQWVKHKQRQNRTQNFIALLEVVPGNTKKEKKALLKHIETAFYTLQSAEKRQNPALAQAYCTEKMLVEQQEALTNLVEKQEYHYIEKIKLNSLDNFVCLTENRFRVRLDFSCIHSADTATGAVFANSQHERLYFQQNWYFQLEPNGSWKVDFIQPL